MSRGRVAVPRRKSVNVYDPVPMPLPTANELRVREKERRIVLTRVLIRKPADAVTLLDMLGIIPGEAKS